MKVKELWEVTNYDLPIILISDNIYTGFFRTLSAEMPPTFLNMEIEKVYPHKNGDNLELAIELKGEK